MFGHYTGSAKLGRKIKKRLNWGVTSTTQSRVFCFYAHCSYT